jgi:hypothetical protein
MLTITLLAIAMLANPVIAVSPKKIPVTATAQVIPGSIDRSDPDYRNEVNEGGVRQWRALLSQESVELFIGDSQNSIPFTASIEMDGRWKTISNQVNHVNVVWTNTACDGGFEGVLQWKILYEGPAGPEAGTWHGVLQGWGTYEGQKLQLEGFWNGGPTKGPSTYTGFLLIP